MGLTISELLSISSKLGFTNQTGNKRRTTLSKPEEGSTIKSRIIFRPGSKAERDSAIREQALLEIMENRGISRAEAEIILADPF